MKQLVKQILYGAGVTGLFHRLRNRHTLTCVMLHRVLPDSESKRNGANPEWTLEDKSFDELLQFLKKHYNPVKLEQIRQWAISDQPLPPRAVFLTFDDGWRDNYEYALPLIRRHAIPAHVFVVSDKIGSNSGLWQEQLFAAAKLSPISALKLVHAIQTSGAKVTDLKTAENWLSEHEPVEKNCIELLDRLRDGLPKDRQMMSTGELSKCLLAGISLGGHGASHAPLTALSTSELNEELKRSRKILSILTDTEIDSISFPHGSTSAKVHAACYRGGFGLIFGSESAIMATRSKYDMENKAMPRIHLDEHALGDGSGFVPAQAAHSMFFRPVK